MSSFPSRRGTYGFDAPYAPLLMALGGVRLSALSVSRLFSGEANSTQHAISIIAPGVAALWLFLNAGVFAYATRVGKFGVWAQLIDRLDLKGNEHLLDIGCGRGAVLLMAAQRLPRGRSAISPLEKSGSTSSVRPQRNGVFVYAP